MYQIISFMYFMHANCITWQVADITEGQQGSQYDFENVGFFRVQDAGIQSKGNQGYLPLILASGNTTNKYNIVWDDDTNGIDATITIPYATEAAPKDYCAMRLIIGGLKGGHSGMEINTGRANANKLLFRHIRWVADCGIRLVNVDGGNMRNAIPRDAMITFAMPKAHKECIVAELEKVAGWVKKEIGRVEPDFFMKLEPVRMYPKVITEADTQKIINTVMIAPNGVIRMSKDMEGLVETSLNLAIMNTNGKNFTIKALLRSSVDSAKDALAERLVCLAELAGGKCQLTGAYPGWKPNMESGLLKTMKQTYKKLYGKEPAVVAIHAGLECGLLGGKYPDMEMISFGPTLNSPHSPDERANIESSKKFFDYLVAALAAMPKVK